eukprot:ANDGO_04816.mRNA.1 hypothetical protein
MFQFIKSYPVILSGGFISKRLPWSELRALDAESAAKIDEDVADLLVYGSLAPSSHNVQPWKVRLTGRRSFVIQIDSSRVIPHTDPHNREMLHSIGAFLQSVVLAGRAKGLTVNYEIISTSAVDTDVVRVAVLAPPAAPADLMTQDTGTLQLLATRTTDRRAYDSKRPLLESHVRAMTELSPAVLYYAADSDEGRWIAQGSFRAFEKQSKDSGKQKELSRWITNSFSAAKTSQAGLTPEALGIPWFLRNLFYTVFTKSFMASTTFAGFSVPDSKIKVEAVAGFVVLYAEDQSPQSMVEVGFLYMDLLLLFGHLGIRSHTYSAILQESPFNQELITVLGLGTRIPAIVLRVGYSDDPPLEAISLRRPLASFLDFSAIQSSPT